MSIVLDATIPTLESTKNSLNAPQAPSDATALALLAWARLLALESASANVWFQNHFAYTMTQRDLTAVELTRRLAEMRTPPLVKLLPAEFRPSDVIHMSASPACMDRQEIVDVYAVEGNCVPVDVYGLFDIFRYRWPADFARWVAIGVRHFDNYAVVAAPKGIDNAGIEVIK